MRESDPNAASALAALRDEQANAGHSAEMRSGTSDQSSELGGFGGRVHPLAQCAPAVADDLLTQLDMRRPAVLAAAPSLERRLSNAGDVRDLVGRQKLLVVEMGGNQCGHGRFLQV